MQARVRSGWLAIGAAVAAGFPAAAAAQDGVWGNPAGGSWTGAANWNGGIVANGTDRTADFASLNITAAATVTLDADRTIGNLVFGDRTTASHDWTLSPGVPAGALTLDVSSGAPVINVTNRTATISARIEGTMGLVKLGSGTLNLSVSNAYSGATEVRGGRIAINSKDAFGASPSVLLRASAGSGYIYGDLAGGVTISNTTLILGGHDNNNRGVLRAAGANATWAGDIIVSATNHNLNLLQTDSSTFVIGGNVTNDGGANAGLQLRGGSSGRINGSIHLTGGLGKNDGGTWTLYGTNNLWTSMAVSQGILRMGAAHVCVPTAAVTWATDKTILTLDLNGFDQTVRGLSAGTIYSGKVVSATAATLTIDTAGSSYTSLAAIQGSIALVKAGAGTQSLQNTNTWTGATVISNGTLRLLRADILPDATDVTLAGGTLDLNARSDTIGSLTLASTAGGLANAAAVGETLALISTGDALAWRAAFNLSANLSLVAAIPSRVVVTNFAGTAGLSGILDLGATNREFDVSDVNAAGPDLYMDASLSGAGGLVKTGGGAMNLSAPSTYSGETVVQAGQLLVNNTLGSGTGPGAVTVTGGTLGGTGRISGAVTVAAGAKFAAGNSVGTNTVGSLTLTPGSTFEVEADGAAADQTISLGPVDLGGATLSTVEINPATFTSALILSNATGQITGYFAGLGESSPVTIGTATYYIHYRPTYVELNLSPTAVVLHQFGAIAEGAKVVVRWRTASEVRTAGFDVYRKVDGEWVKVNEAPIAAAGAAQGGIGASYAVTDAGAAAGGTYEYKLVEIELDGTRNEYGPYERTATAFEMTSPIRATADGMEVRWLSREGERYRVLRATDLRTSAPEVIGRGVGATPPENVFLDTNAAPLRVYRVELEP